MPEVEVKPVGDAQDARDASRGVIAPPVLERTPQVKPRWTLDLDHNGVPDWREAWFWRRVYMGARWVVRRFAGEHTRVRAITDAIDDLDAELEKRRLGP